MSFSKAKLVRFNDKKTTPTLSSNLNKPVSCMCRKTTNKTVPPSPTTSENGSVKSAPANFKTPTLPIKTFKAVTNSATKPNNKPQTPSVVNKNLFNKNDLEALKEKTAECENKTKYIHQLTDQLDKSKKELEKFGAEKEQLQREHQNERQNLEFEMLQTMIRLQKQEEEADIKIKELEKKLAEENEALKKSNEYHLGQVVLDYEIKIKELKQNNDEELKRSCDELDNSWKEKIKLEEEQSKAAFLELEATAQLNAAKFELEKMEIEKQLEETRQTYNLLQLSYKELKAKHDQLEQKINDNEADLQNKIKDLTEIKDKQEEEIKKSNADLKIYHITINNSHNTIEVLKKRLIESDGDVEQLKTELADCEEKLINYEAKCLHLDTELKTAQKINEDLELQYESSLKINEKAIMKVKNELLVEVKFYEDKVKNYTEQCYEYDVLKVELEDTFENMKKINLQVEKMEKIYFTENQELLKVIETAKENEEMNLQQIEDLKNENEDILIELDNKEHTIIDLEEKVEKLEEKNTELNDNCSYYKKLAEEFEVEAKENAQTRKNYIDISGKYDALFQNFEELKLKNNQDDKKINEMMNKIADLAKIQQECELLKKEKALLENENASYKNKFEDLKGKKYKISIMEKENIGSPNRSIIESPNRGSPFRSSPFRERN